MEKQQVRGHSDGWEWAVCKNRSLTRAAPRKPRPASRTPGHAWARCQGDSRSLDTAASAREIAATTRTGRSMGQRSSRARDMRGTSAPSGVEAVAFAHFITSPLAAAVTACKPSAQRCHEPDFRNHAGECSRRCSSASPPAASGVTLRRDYNRRSCRRPASCAAGSVGRIRPGRP
jgi:hypothetical protein